jgi:hypothetical protein
MAIDYTEHTPTAYEWTLEPPEPIARFYVRGPITAAVVGQDEIVVNSGLAAWHMTVAESMQMQRAITDARIAHAEAHGERWDV